MVNTLLNVLLIISATNKTALPVACEVHAHIQIVRQISSLCLYTSLASNNAMLYETGIGRDRHLSFI